MGVGVDTLTGKVLVDERDTTSVPSIHTIGDAAYVRRSLHEKQIIMNMMREIWI